MTTLRPQQFGRYAFPIVTHRNAELPWGVLEIDLDAGGPGVEECVDQSLPPNAIGFVSYYRIERSGFTSDDHAENHP
ncbi:MAG TPA: hypothetical protein VJX47_04245 [Candidatus Sulfotelmatobacter sp.]|nr:hypothetical protein [Candidatus Sulfotelmatobacter sp.]